MNKIEDYIVLENPNYDGTTGKYFIAKRSNFETTPICETYGNYGIQLDHDECCGEGEEHWEVMAWTYWDGHNWKTIILNEDNGYNEVDEEISEEILREMPKETPHIEGISIEIKTENHTFYYSRRMGFNWVAIVD